MKLKEFMEKCIGIKPQPYQLEFMKTLGSSEPIVMIDPGRRYHRLPAMLKSYWRARLLKVLRRRIAGD